MDNPIAKFQHWWQRAIADSPLHQKSAVCVSTVDEHGFPSGRFVDLKSVDERGFAFCTPLSSAKGEQLLRNPKVAITAWWDHVGYQVRVVGLASLIEEGEAAAFWQSRSRSAQLTTTAFEQSQPLAHEYELQRRLAKATKEHEGLEISKPNHWGGYRVKPVSIEFLTFRDSRLHLRELYEDQGRGWSKRLLQP